MGNPKQKWTAEEEEALRAGVAKHGTGKWKNIQKDPEFNHFLYTRSNIDLKDKWRNMSVGANPREKSRTPKAKASTDAPVSPLMITYPPTAATTSTTTNNTTVTPSAVGAPPTSSTPLTAQPPSDVSASTAPTPPDTATAMIEDSSKCILDGKTASKYNAMIYEALSTLKDPNGSDTSAIVSFIEKRNEVPPNFRRLLSARLRRLVTQDKLEKVQNCYRIKKDVLLGTKTPIPKPKETGARPTQTLANSNSNLGDTIQEAAVQAAYKIAEAENKSFVAAEAIKEAERVAKMAEDAEAMLELIKEIYDRCSQGEVVYVN